MGRKRPIRDGRYSLNQKHLVDQARVDVGLVASSSCSKRIGLLSSGRGVGRGLGTAVRYSAPLRQLARPLGSLQDAKANSLVDPHSDSVKDQVPPCHSCGIAALSLCPDCEREFCHSHIYCCSSCDVVLCALCLDAHRLAGHWDDSETTRERHCFQSPPAPIQSGFIT